MSQKLVDQITLDCLLNKELMGNHVMKQREKQINKNDLKFYRKRIYNLFKEIISNNSPDNLSPDVKYSYNTFIQTSIDYIKVIDNNDLLQEEYKDFKHIQTISSEDLEKEKEQNNTCEADKLMMRSVKMDIPTLDKYVKRTTTKQKEKTIFLPKSREVDISNPELKNKGLKNKG